MSSPVAATASHRALRTMRVPGFAVYRGVHRSGSELPRHTHDDPTICYVMRGRFTEYVVGKSVDCVTDTLKLMPAGETHWNRFAADETHGLRIDVDSGRFDESAAIQRLLHERAHVRGVRVGHIISSLLTEIDAHDDAAALAVEGLLLELLARLAREAERGRESSLPRFVRDADELIRAQFTLSISLDDIAQAVGVAPSTLARRYRRAYRLTVGDRIRQLRIDRAAHELRHTDHALSVIALRAGFYDQSHFSNLFRRQLGVTPSAYRRVAADVDADHNNARSQS